MDNTLQHYGILGMRWGVRRFQNKDGTLTPAGKRREEKKKTPMSDEEITSKIKRLNLEKQHEKLKKEALDLTTLGRTKKVIDETSDFVRQVNKLNNDSIKKNRTKETLDLSDMTDKQLREQINRTLLERQYNDLFAKEATISKGQSCVTNILEYGGSVLAIGSSALGIALAIKQLKTKGG